MTKYRFTSAALSELREATLYYEEKENGLGAAFLDEVDATVERTLRFSRAWHPISARPDDAELTAFHSEFFIKSDLMKFLSPQ